MHKKEEIKTLLWTLYRIRHLLNKWEGVDNGIVKWMNHDKKLKILCEMEGIVNVLDENEEDTVRMIDN